MAVSIVKHNKNNTIAIVIIKYIVKVDNIFKYIFIYLNIFLNIFSHIPNIISGLTIFNNKLP